MTLPSSIIGAFVLVAEKVLLEADGVPSIIRIADVFYVPPMPDPPVERAPIFMYIVASVRFKTTESTEHVLQLQLLRPSGETKPIGNPNVLKSQPRVTGLGVPAGFNVISTVGVLPKESGVHYIVAMMDGEEIARTVITLVTEKDGPKSE